MSDVLASYFGLSLNSKSRIGRYPQVPRLRDDFMEVLADEQPAVDV
jgi:hypothetical protein